MQKKLLMGNEAAALGAIRAGVKVVSGYPGTPSTETLEAIARNNDGSVYVEWAPNEKVALEVAAGAAVSGARAMVTMKQMGLNVAADPLMSLNMIGVTGGMVVYVADDPGPLSSQTEQDTRHYAKFAKLALFDPSSPEEAYNMIADAFEYSEKLGRPVILRPTTRICHSYASVELLGKLPVKEPEGFAKDSRWVIFPVLSHGEKIKIEKNLRGISEEFSEYARNIITDGKGRKGVISGGVSYAYTREALAMIGADCKLMKVSTVPVPEKLILKFLEGLDEVIVFEELDPFIENELFQICGKHNINVKIYGKHSGHTQIAGENTPGIIAKAAADFLGLAAPVQTGSQTRIATSVIPENTPPLPVRPSVMCAGCPHRASFFALKEATKNIKSVYTGDIGCYTLGNAAPLEMVDTCLCMGGGITMAQGMRRVAPDTVHFCVIGDSTYFHSGITGVINAAYNQTDIVIVILDNSITAMTGGQPHPGTAKTMMGTVTEPLSCEKISAALNISKLIKVNPFDQKAAKQAVKDVIGSKGVRVIIFEALCNNLTKPDPKLEIDKDKCSGCGVCVKKLGCPAISINENKKAEISALCTGCGICADLCGPDAIIKITEDIKGGK
jgi:indolepyruvate ferredoxin oxidoreductase alpha subunit